MVGVPAKLLNFFWYFGSKPTHDHQTANNCLVDDPSPETSCVSTLPSPFQSHWQIQKQAHQSCKSCQHRPSYTSIEQEANTAKCLRPPRTICTKLHTNLFTEETHQRTSKRFSASNGILNQRIVMVVWWRALFSCRQTYSESCIDHHFLQLQECRFIVAHENQLWVSENASKSQQFTDHQVPAPHGSRVPIPCSTVKHHQTSHCVYILFNHKLWHRLCIAKIKWDCCHTCSPCTIWALLFVSASTKTNAAGTPRGIRQRRKIM